MLGCVDTQGKYLGLSDIKMIYIAVILFLIVVTILVLLMRIIRGRCNKKINQISKMIETTERNISTNQVMCNKIITDYSLPSSLFDYNHLPSILERLEKYKNESLKASIDGYYATIRAQSGAAAEWRKGEERRERLDRQYREEVARQNDREVLQSINNKLDYWIHH